MSAAPVFNQVGSSSLYGLSTASEAGIDGYWAGYCATSKSGLGETASAASVWQDVGGFYLFLKHAPKTPEAWTAFESNLQKLRPNLGPPDALRCLWLDNPTESYLGWTFDSMEARATGHGAGIAWQLLRAFSFHLGEYQLLILGLSALSYVDDADGGGFQFSGEGKLIGPGGGYVFTPGKLSFSGVRLGVVTGGLAVPKPKGDDSLWSTLKIGLQYGQEPLPPEQKETSTSSSTGEEPEVPRPYKGATEMLYMPVFDGQASSLSLGVGYDPLNPLVFERTALDLFVPGGTAPGKFSSHLRTTKGYAVELEPLANNGVLPSARFVFSHCPVSVNLEGVKSYHLSPDGAFKMHVKLPSKIVAEDVSADSYRALLGLSGLEYVTLDGQTSSQVVFEGGHPAYIPAVDPKSSEAPAVENALTNTATTSHLTMMPFNLGDEGLVYYAQPKQAPVFSGREPGGADVLYFNEIPAFTLGTGHQNRPKVFPSGIYAGLSVEQTSLAEVMELASIAPYRHYVIGEAYGVGVSKEAVSECGYPERRVRAASDPLGITPQGLVAELTPDYQDYDGLYLGNMPGTNYPKVDLTVVTGKFKQAIQSNQLFFVAANVDVLMRGTSVRYKLDDGDKPYLLAREVPQSVIDAVYVAIQPLPQPFDTEAAFRSAISDAAGTYLDDFLDVAGILKIEMDGWTFQLSPRSWRTSDESPTLMVAKFCKRSLLDIAGDSSSWAWPEVATPDGGTLLKTQKILYGICQAAGAEGATEDDKIFFDTVVNNANWNGFLFLNAPVDISEMPDDLKFLVAGIDTDKFFAHHIGFSQTPFHVTGGMPVLEQTAAFGLIDYNDPQDLYAEQTIPLGFKTMKLKVRFANAALVDFSAQVELMINRMLATPLNKREAARGNNLIINGSYQRVGGAPSYAFALIGQNIFDGTRSALTSLEVLSVHLLTGGQGDSDKVLTTFLLMGNLRFISHEYFDLFSFGPDGDNEEYYLRYGGLPIDMSFSLATPKQQTFLTREQSMSFDLANSKVRSNGLLNNFPLSVDSLIASPNLTPDSDKATGQTPEEMGFTSISAPIDQTPMEPSWYGLQMTLDMGTLGALTGGNSMKILVLAAWSEGKGQSDAPVYVGIKLPHIPAVGGSFPLQGVLKLGFRSFQFDTYPITGEGDKTLGYNLKLRRFALSILVWNFPPGNTDIILFGEPGNPRGSLGWYAAYDSGDDGKEDEQQRIGVGTGEVLEMETIPKDVPTDRIQRKLRSGRRVPPVS